MVLTKRYLQILGRRKTKGQNGISLARVGNDQEASTKLKKSTGWFSYVAFYHTSRNLSEVNNSDCQMIGESRILLHRNSSFADNKPL